MDHRSCTKKNFLVDIVVDSQIRTLQEETVLTDLSCNEAGPNREIQTKLSESQNESTIPRLLTLVH